MRLAGKAELQADNNRNISDTSQADRKNTEVTFGNCSDSDAQTLVVRRMMTPLPVTSASFVEPRLVGAGFSLLRTDALVSVQEEVVLLQGFRYQQP